MIEKIVRKIGLHFRTFGGGRGTPNNPIVQALKDQPLCFVAGVDVADVVVMVLKESENDELLDACEMMLRLMEGENLDEKFDGEAEVLRSAIINAKKK